MTVDTSVFARIIKQEKQADGTLLVTGIATDDTLDIDEQICDPEWLERAMPAWFKYGNIREQHSNVAAGVATKLEVDGTKHVVTARVVDPGSVNKVELGVLKGFSIGIRNPRISTDKAAPGGRIVDGEIVEVSLVDRPANPSCLLELAKSVGGIMQQTETLIEKEAVMERCSKCSKAYKSDELMDGTCKMCKAALEESSSGAEESSTEDSSESSSETSEESSSSASQAQESASKAKPVEGEVSEESSVVKGDMGACKECGADCAVGDMMKGMCDKCYGMKAAAEESSQKIGEESSQVMGEESSRPNGIAGVAGRAAETSEDSNIEGSLDEESSEESSEETSTPAAKSVDLQSIASDVAEMKAMLTELTKSMTDDSAEGIAKSVKLIDERVSKVEKSATRGPVRTVVKASVNPAVDEKAIKAAKAADYRNKSAATSDPALASAYLLAAAELEN